MATISTIIPTNNISIHFLFVNLQKKMNPIIDQLALETIKSQRSRFDNYFDKLINKANITYQTTFKKNREHFWNYLNRTNNKFSSIRPVGFDVQLDFLKVYIPLTLEISEGVKRKKNIVIDKYPDAFRSSKNILIVDNAGMGKSTISKRLFIGAFEDGSCGIPIFIELRHLSKDNDIVHEILNQIKNLSTSFNEDLLLTLIENGGFIFFLDGYDEIAINEKAGVTKSLQSFIEKAGNNRFILTSREDDALSGFQTFDKYSIKQLTKKDAFKLLSNLDNNGEKSQTLINKLKGEELASVNEFLTNPLLVTLLFTAFNYEPTIPLKKYLFYNQVYNAFFQQHDLSKGDDFCHAKKSKLEKDDFERVLSCIGFISILNHKVEFSESEIIKTIEIAKEKSKEKCTKLEFRESDYLSDLCYSVPLFSKEGNNYKWVHKSMSEYFAVKYFTENTDEKNLIEKIITRDTLNDNILDFYHDMKPSSFRQFILLPFLTEIKEVLLPESENLYKKILCTFLLGNSIIILLGPNKNDIEIKYKRDVDHTINFIYLVSFFYNFKHLLFTRITIDYEEMKLSNAFKLLKGKRQITICSKNINEIEPSIIKEIILPKFMAPQFSYGTKTKGKISLPYLTTDMCNSEIESIEKEIAANKDLDSYRI